MYIANYIISCSSSPLSHPLSSLFPLFPLLLSPPSPFPFLHSIVPLPTVSLPDDFNVTYSEALRIKCTVTSLMRPSSIKWYQNGSLLANRYQSGFTRAATPADTYTSILVKGSAGLNDTGAYTCVAVNAAGQGNDTVNVQVIGECCGWSYYTCTCFVFYICTDSTCTCILFTFLPPSLPFFLLPSLSPSLPPFLPLPPFLSPSLPSSLPPSLQSLFQIFLTSPASMSPSVLMPHSTALPLVLV